jgi:copper(I)-binding protein
MNDMRTTSLRISRAHRLVSTAAVIGALALGLTACGSDSVDQGAKTSSESTIGELGVTGQWARATIASTTNTAVYFTVVSAADDRLTGVAVDASVAERAEMHQTMTMPTGTADASGNTTVGEMQMGPVSGIDVKAGTPLVLEPGGYHVMLFALAKPLAEGDTISVTLTFQTHGDVTIDVPVLTEAP